MRVIRRSNQRQFVSVTGLLYKLDQVRGGLGLLAWARWVTRPFRRLRNSGGSSTLSAASCCSLGTTIWTLSTRSPGHTTVQIPGQNWQAELGEPELLGIPSPWRSCVNGLQSLSPAREWAVVLGPEGWRAPPGTSGPRLGRSPTSLTARKGTRVSCLGSGRCC